LELGDALVIALAGGFLLFSGLGCLLLLGEGGEVDLGGREEGREGGKMNQSVLQATRGREGAREGGREGGRGPTWKSSFLSLFILVAWLWEGWVLTSPPPEEEEADPRDPFFFFDCEGGRE